MARPGPRNGSSASAAHRRRCALRRGFGEVIRSGPSANANANSGSGCGSRSREPNFGLVA